jgi:hypothetical protein
MRAVVSLRAPGGVARSTREACRTPQELAQNPECKNGPALLQSLGGATDKGSIINLLAQGALELERGREDANASKWVRGLGRVPGPTRCRPERLLLRSQWFGEALRTRCARRRHELSHQDLDGRGSEQVASRSP